MIKCNFFFSSLLIRDTLSPTLQLIDDQRCQKHFASEFADGIIITSSSGKEGGLE